MAKTEYGLQMCSVEDVAKQRPYKEVLCEVAKLGYKYVEFCGYYGHTAEEIKSFLEEYDLKVSGAHTGTPWFEEEKIDETIRFHKAIGCDTLIIPGCDWSTPEKRDELIENFAKWQKRLESEGMHLAYHNHDSEFMKTGYDIVFADDVLKKSSIELEVDTFWTFNARIDTIDFLNKYKDRIRVLHIKDGISCKEEEMIFGKHRIGVEHRPVGYGENDIKAIYDWATENNVLMVVECENREPSGLYCSKQCIDYLKTLEE